MDFINALMPNFERLSGELLECIGQTFTMLAVSGSIAWVLGVAVGVLRVPPRRHSGKSLAFYDL